jgi:hypothetical protein
VITNRYHPAPPIAVWCDDAGTPERFIWRRRDHTVAEVESSWRMDHGFWQADPLSRAYHQLRCCDGLRCVVYRDLLDGTWHLEGIID